MVSLSNHERRVNWNQRTATFTLRQAQGERKLARTSLTNQVVKLNKSKFIPLAASLWLVSAAVWAQQQVVIVTSFPKELTEAYKKAFEAKNPGIKV